MRNRDLIFLVALCIYIVFGMSLELERETYEPMVDEWVTEKAEEKRLEYEESIVECEIVKTYDEVRGFYGFSRTEHILLVDVNGELVEVSVDYPLYENRNHLMY